MDTLDVTDRHYDKKYQDMQNRLYDFYDEIEVVEEQITELQECGMPHPYCVSILCFRGRAMPRPYKIDKNYQHKTNTT